MKGIRAVTVLLALGLAAAPAREGAAEGGKAGVAAGAKGRGKKPTPPAPLEGTTYDFSYDGKDVGHPERAWLGRAFVHKKAQAAGSEKALPLVVFVHGINKELIKYRWMGGGSEGDVRRIVGDMMEAGQLPPVLVAAPSSVVAQNIVAAPSSWHALDLDHFVDKTAAALKGAATIDRTKIIVAAHSGGGCNAKGGIATAIKAKNIHTALVIDTCMMSDLATALGKARKSLNVVVTWQSISWGSRSFKDFRTIFEREVKASPPDAGALRVLDFMQPKEAMPHDAMVPLTLRKYLPQLLPVAKQAGAGAPAAPAPPAAPTKDSP